MSFAAYASETNEIRDFLNKSIENDGNLSPTQAKSDIYLSIILTF